MAGAEVATTRSPGPPLLFGAAALLLGTGLFLLGSGQRATTAHLAGPPLPVSRDAVDPLNIDANNSPSLATDPTDPNSLVVVNRVDSPVFSCGFHYSLDAGTTWFADDIPIPAGEEPKCFAPDASFGADGTLYLVYVTLRGLGNTPNAAWMVTSRDGGRTLSRPRHVLGPLAFQLRVLADPARPGRVYLVWLQAGEVGNLLFSDPANPIQFARSDDHGATWQGPSTVNDPGHVRAVAPSIAVGPDGELFVSYLDLGNDRLDYHGGHEGLGGPPYPGRWVLAVARSGDRGATWTQSIVDDAVVPIERFVVFLPPSPTLAVDEGSGRVYAAFHGGRGGDPDVYLWSSDDGGRTFSSPVRVNDTPLRDGTSQYLPKVAVAPTGRVDVVYFDRRSDPQNVMNELSLQSSFDGGGTFSPRLRLSDRPFDSRVGFGTERGLPDLGSRLALVSTEREALAVWPDTRAGTTTTKKQDLARAVVVFETERRPAAAVRLGGMGLAVVGVAGALVWLVGMGRRRRDANS